MTDEQRAWQWFEDGEISLATMGELLIGVGYSPREARLALSEAMHYPIPVNYFGKEMGEGCNDAE